MASIFTQIVKGTLPSSKILEDKDTLSFLTIAPISLGHTLVIPKKEIDSFLDLPQELYHAVMDHCRHISPAIQQATGKKRICLAIQGFEVPHCHVHLIPCNTPKEFDFSFASPRSPEQIEQIAEKIRKNLGL